MKDAPTRREGEVLTLIGRGLLEQVKSLASLSSACSTVKHHVHHALAKAATATACAGDAPGPRSALDRVLTVSCASEDRG